jgi:hypothetical protein
VRGTDHNSNAQGETALGIPISESQKPSPKEYQLMNRSCISGLLAGAIVLIGVTQAVGQQKCRPTLAVTEVKFSKWKLPSMERRWTAVVSVDASRCAVNSGGYFEIGFSRLKENGMELEFREQFIWLPPSVLVGVDFWADEAVERYWVDNVTPCTCRD